MKLESLQYIKGIGPRRAEVLAEIGILNTIDLLMYFPRAYIDRNAQESLSEIHYRLKNDDDFISNASIDKIKLKSQISVIVKISSKNLHKIGKNRELLKLQIRDESRGSAQILFWNRASYFEKTYQIDDYLLVSGKPEIDNFNNLIFNHPEILKIDNEEKEMYLKGAILPLYKLTEKMTQVGLGINAIRKIMKLLLEKDLLLIEETLPDYLIKKYKFPKLNETIINLHFPESIDLLERSRKRVKFEEILFFLLKLEINKQRIISNSTGIKIDPKSKLARKLYDSLPFELTSDQKKVIREISEDMSSGKNMNRLLQGDVGSGKTIVSIFSMLMAIDAGLQVIIMAPTEILAEQHFHSINKLLVGMNINIGQLVGGQKTKLRREILEKISTGEYQIIVGTHALFQSEVQYKNLGLVIIDEQHRFGVEQRAELIKLASQSNETKNFIPHVLVMSATPIPRTLTMTVYGDLDLSIIKSMPKDRKPIKTKITFDKNILEVWEFIRSEINEGRQAYIVYPLVEKSDKLEFKAATEHFEQLSTHIFPEFKCGLLHGQMLWYEKEDAMKAFLSKEFDILVATTVVEVGIDVANASVMVIEDAERFGLSQLHQLRGRVGRGSEQSYCILVTKDHFKYQLKNSNNDNDERTAAIIRLKTMEETSDGFQVAEVDLKLRGPGDMLGTRQSGLPDFKFLDLINDNPIISEGKRLVKEILDKDPHLRANENNELRVALRKKMGSNRGYFDIA